MSKKNLREFWLSLGGTSGEREMSLDSGRACVKALKTNNLLFQFDPKLKKFELNLKAQKTDVIFNALHGKDGEDGIAQSYFEYLGIPYTHSGVISSHNAMNKIISKNIFRENNIPTPNYFTLKKFDFNQNLINQI